MQNFCSIGSVLVLSTRPKYYNNKNKDEQTDMYEHLDPLSEQGGSKIFGHNVINSAVGTLHTALRTLEKKFQ